uniref:cytochrome-c oxidase n=1 Tax=Meloidogyne graminicola TaxID=189291 RepID=A0A060QMG0_9BILA|nr:cytochrome c oxidase subunit II [Meloidogyne graminicola]
MIFSNNELNFFHDYNCFLLVFIMMFISMNYIFVINIMFFQKINLSYKNVELKCCFFPLLILVLQLIPSLFLFFEMIFFFEDYFLTLKIIGHQWYWSYEYGDFFSLGFDSYMKDFEYLFLGDEMFLEVDNHLIVPNDMLIRFVATSSDVIHSWGLPNFFLKLDVMSGIMSVFNFNFNLLGIFFGQCSEICGANHSFMPIVLEIVLFDFFKLILISY